MPSALTVERGKNLEKCLNFEEFEGILNMASNRVTYPGVGVESVQISERDGVDNPMNPYADTLRRKHEERGNR